MGIRNAIEHILGATKKVIYGDMAALKAIPKKPSYNYQNGLEVLSEKVETFEENNPLRPQPLSTYESRRSSIEESDEPIEGIFFIIDGKLIHDYYSECLFSEIDIGLFSAKNQQNPHKLAMYHDYFFENYIKNVYKGIASTAKKIPRGRIQKLCDEESNIFIDKCYFNDEALIQQIVNLYRLSGEISILNFADYRCPACSIPIKNDDLMRYTLPNIKKDTINLLNVR